MSEGYLLAIDVGTTTTRCMLFDLEGAPVAASSREPLVYHPHTNWAEMEAEDWWGATVTVIREALARADVPNDRIIGIGLSGLEHTLVPIDDGGKPLSRPILWMDQRSAPQLEWLKRELRGVIKDPHFAAVALSASSSAPKLRWMVEHQPDVVRRTHRFLLVKDYVRLKLTGGVATDPYDALNTGLFDQRAEEWSSSILDLIGVPLEKMPPVYEATHVVGGVSEEAARGTGLAPGTPVVVGSGDVLCTCVGANAFDSTHACLYLGTAAWVFIPHRSSSAGSIISTTTTGAALKWLVKLVVTETDPLSDAPLPYDDLYNALLREAAGVPAGSSGLVFLPHLIGERGPQPDPNAKGVLFGLTLAHNRADIARAVLEGCAFQLRRILEDGDSHDIEEMVVVGGGAKSALWLAIISDVLGIRLHVPRVLEAGALGAAILAGVGVGVYADVREAAQNLVRFERQQEPNGACHELYSQIYRVYLTLEESVAPLYGRLPVNSLT